MNFLLCLPKSDWLLLLRRATTFLVKKYLEYVKKRNSIKKNTYNFDYLYNLKRRIISRTSFFGIID